MLELFIAQTDAGQWLQDVAGTVLDVLPILLAFVLILIVGYWVAKAIAEILNRVLQRAGFSRVVERGGVARVLERTTHDASDILSRLVFYGLLLFVLQLAFGLFGPNPVSDLISGVVAFLPRLFVAVVIVVVASVVAIAVKGIVEAGLGGLHAGRLVALAASASVVVIGVFAALNQLRVAPAIVNALFYALLAVIAGSAIVAIGGGGIVPMRRQWERALRRIEEDIPRGRESVAGSGAPSERGLQQADGHPASPEGAAAAEPGAGAMGTPHVERAGAAAVEPADVPEGEAVKVSRDRGEAGEAPAAAPVRVPRERDETVRVPREQDETVRVPREQDETVRVPREQDETAALPPSNEEPTQGRRR